VLVKFFKEMSSNFWDSRIVDDRELESPEVGRESFFVPVSFDFHPERSFLGGSASEIVRVRIVGEGSIGATEADRSARDGMALRVITNSGDNGDSGDSAT
jgi:hypothetical protein